MAFSTHDIVPDSPTNNFATMNPLVDKIIGNPKVDTISEGNLIVRQAASFYAAIGSTISIPKSGKWYAECNFKSVAGTLLNSAFGIGCEVGSYNHYIYDTPYAGTGIIIKWNDGTETSTENVGIATAGDILSIYIDADSGIAQIKKNNIDVSTPYTMSSADINYYIIYVGWGHSGDGCIYNFGQDPSFGGSKSPTTTYTDANGIGAFYYQPPTGALALCTANLPDFTLDVTGDTPQHYFKAVLYTGNGSTQSITGVGFQPDFVWSKPRSAGFNIVRDSVRGSTYRLITDGTYAELSDSNYGTFSSDGFNLGAENNINANTVNYIAWCFRAGGAPSGSTSTTGSAKRINTSGTQDDTSCSALATAATNAGASNVITPTLMSINQAAGFSIIKYNTGQTGHLTGGPYSIPHGLGAEPKFIIIKSISNAYDWLAYHRSVGNVNYTQLNASNVFALSDSNTYSGSNTEYVVNIGGTVVIAADGDYIMYSWSPVEGYSKFGSYVGNGSADGPFVHCGFRPAFVMVKNTDTTSTNWMIWDNARDAHNVTDSILRANTSDIENDGTWKIDFLSNGFKIRTVSSDHVNSTSGDTYIFMAFSEQPFKFSNAR